MTTNNLFTKFHYNYLSIKDRIKSEEPNFFIQLKKIAIKLAVASVAVIGVNATLSLNLNPELITTLQYIIASCVAVYGSTSILKSKD